MALRRGAVVASGTVLGKVTAAPGARITWDGAPLPFPAALEAVGFDRDVGPFPRTQLPYGVAATMAHFRRTLAAS